MNSRQNGGKGNGRRGRGNFDFQVDERTRNNQRIGIFVMAGLFLFYSLWRVIRHFMQGENTVGILLFGIFVLGGGGAALLLLALWYYRHPPVVEDEEAEEEKEMQEAEEMVDAENAESVEAEKEEKIDSEKEEIIDSDKKETGGFFKRSDISRETEESGSEESISNKINAALNKLNDEDEFVEEDDPKNTNR